MKGSELAEAWLASVKEQLEAARHVDANALRAATEARAALQDQLLAFLSRASSDRRRQFSAVATEVRALDLRIRGCGATVVAALDALLPAARPATYTRHAVLRDTP